MENYQLIISNVFIVLVAAMLFVSLWKIFQKAGVAGWKSLIPFYNSYLYFKIAGRNGWQFLLLLIPFVNIVVAFSSSVSFAKRFGKGTGFGVGLVLLSIVFYPILAFDKSTYAPKSIENDVDVA